MTKTTFRSFDLSLYIPIVQSDSLNFDILKFSKKQLQYASVKSSGNKIQCLWGIFPGAACLGVLFATELQILKLGYCQARVFLSFSPDLMLKYSYDYT